MKYYFFSYLSYKVVEKELLSLPSNGVSPNHPFERMANMRNLDPSWTYKLISFQEITEQEYILFIELYKP